jgi:nitrogen regulatory protein PII-like uncharacterized protein
MIVENSYLSMVEFIGSEVCRLVMENNFAGKVGLSPQAWQQLLKEASSLANCCTVEDVEDKAVIILRVCGQRVVVHANPRLNWEQVEFFERRPTP